MPIAKSYSRVFQKTLIARLSRAEQDFSAPDVDVRRAVGRAIMKTRYTVILSMIAGAALGGAAIQGLHAQAKPPVYLVTEIDVTNPDAYAKEFAPKAQAIIKAAGGRFVAIGGVAGLGAKPVTAMQGTPPKRVTIQVWDSHEALKAWFNGADYQAALKIGEKYATFRRFAVEGVSQ
jgi:uncharacterized protein (DUF1330 family)